MPNRTTLIGHGSVYAVINGALIGVGELGSMALETATDYLSKAGNLSGLTDLAAARTALGLGTLAVESTPLGVTKGGTGLIDGISGGVLAFTAAGTLASSAALTANALVMGGGAGAVPSTPLGLGTSSQVLHGNAAGAPTWGALALTTDVSGILPGANGGTGNGFTAISGPAASLKTFTLPNASATILTTSSAVTVAQGGTGIASGTSGGLPYFSGSTTIASSGALGSQQVVIGGGAGAAPSTSANLTFDGTKLTATEMSVSAALGQLQINSSTPSNPVLLPLSRAGTINGYLGVAGGTNGVITGSAAGDVCLRGQGQAILLSVDSGTTAALKIDSGGVLNFGTRSALGAEVVTGYITIKDSSGTTRKLAVLS